MNKDLLNQLPADEQPVAEKLSSAAETMTLSPSFQWNLETQLMNAFSSRTEKPKQSLFATFARPIAWAMAAVIAVFLVSWMLRTLLPSVQPAEAPTAMPALSFEEQVRAGKICAGPLAVEHGFAVSLFDPAKNEFVMLNAENPASELRSFDWSADGQRLAILANEQGRGNIYITDLNGTSLQPVLANSELGSLMDAAWSRDGKKVVLWSTQNNRVLYVVNADGTGLVEKNLGNTQILGAPQFWPDGSSVVFYGATPTAIGFFEWILNDTDVTQINSDIASASSYAFSPDGSQLAYMSYDQEVTGQAELRTEDLSTHEVALLGTFSIPKGSGSSVPETANMSWSPDGKSIVFDVGRGANDRVIYLARIGESELLQVVDSGYAPSISADGECLAYINDKKLFLLSMTDPASPLLLADLPVGRSVADYKLDQLQWRP